MCCGTEAGSYLRRIDSCITQLKAQGPSRTCNESKEEEEEVEPEHVVVILCSGVAFRVWGLHRGGIQGLGFGVWCLRFGGWGLGFRILGLGFRV